MRPALNTLFGQKDLVGVEIGVYTGHHAKEILGNAETTMKKLYLVDPYIPYTENGRIFGEATEEKYNNLVKEFKGDDRVQFIRKLSNEASKDVEDGTLDFVYIDGNHEYDYVLLDIESWMPKLKEGGLMSGHDFNGEPGVHLAVLDYCEKHNITIEFVGPDWWFKKWNTK